MPKNVIAIWVQEIAVQRKTTQTLPVFKNWSIGVFCYRYPLAFAEEVSRQKLNRDNDGKGRKVHENHYDQKSTATSVTTIFTNDSVSNFGALFQVLTDRRSQLISKIVFPICEEAS